MLIKINLNTDLNLFITQKISCLNYPLLCFIFLFFKKKIAQKSERKHFFTKKNFFKKNKKLNTKYFYSNIKIMETLR